MPAGTYTVKVGGDKVTAIAVKTFTVTDSTTPDVGTDIIWGDINQDGEVTDSDSIAILSGIVGTANKGTFQVYDNMKAVTGGTEFIWGDINQDGEITDSDSIAILSGIVGTANKGTYQVYDTFKATKK